MYHPRSTEVADTRQLPCPCERASHASTTERYPRTGWVRAGVESESVGAHSWGMALSPYVCVLSISISQGPLVCLVHDVAEIVVGDLTPHDAIKGQEKHELERAGMLKIAPQWIELFDEYEQGTSEEAQFVKTMDKLDMGANKINNIRDWI